MTLFTDQLRTHPKPRILIHMQLSPFRIIVGSMISIVFINQTFLSLYHPPSLLMHVHKFCLSFLYLVLLYIYIPKSIGKKLQKNLSRLQVIGSSIFSFKPSHGQS